MNLNQKLDRIRELYGEGIAKYYTEHPDEIKYFKCYQYGCLDPECQNTGCGNVGCPVHKVVCYGMDKCVYCNNIKIVNDLWIPTYDRRPLLCQCCAKAYTDFAVECPGCGMGHRFRNVNKLKEAWCTWCDVRIKNGNIDHVCQCDL